MLFYQFSSSVVFSPLLFFLFLHIFSLNLSDNCANSVDASKTHKTCLIIKHCDSMKTPKAHVFYLCVCELVSYHHFSLSYLGFFSFKKLFASWILNIGSIHERTNKQPTTLNEILLLNVLSLNT